MRDLQWLADGTHCDGVFFVLSVFRENKQSNAPVADFFDDG